MSLEQAIEKLTTALDKNNALLEAAAGERSKVLAKIDGVAAGAATGGKTDNKAPKDKPAKDAGKVTLESVRKAFGDLLASAEEGPDRDAIKAKIIPFLKKHKVKKATELPEATWPAAIAHVEKVKAELAEADSGDAGDGEEDDLLGE